MIETNELRKVFGEHVALESLNLRVRAGETVGLLGPNGAGKSTLVKMLATLVKPTSGRIQIAGFDAATKPLDVRRRIGYVPETGALFDTLTGYEHLSMVVDLKGLPRSAALRRALELVGRAGTAGRRARSVARLFERHAKEDVDRVGSARQSGGFAA